MRSAISSKGSTDRRKGVGQPDDHGNVGQGERLDQRVEVPAGRAPRPSADRSSKQTTRPACSRRRPTRGVEPGTSSVVVDDEHKQARWVAATELADHLQGDADELRVVDDGDQGEDTRADGRLLLAGGAASDSASRRRRALHASACQEASVLIDYGLSPRSRLPHCRSQGQRSASAGPNTPPIPSQRSVPSVPRGQDGVDDPPGLLYLVAADEQRRVADQARRAAAVRRLRASPR